MKKNFPKVVLSIAVSLLVACGDDSSTSAKDDESLSSAIEESSSSLTKSVSSSSEKNSSSVVSSSSVEGSKYDASTNTLTDLRDNKTYKTVVIGSHIWMAENLRYDYNKGSAKSFCYGNQSSNCDKFGRLYLWSAAMDSAAVFGSDGKGCGYGVECNSSDFVRGACPDGWHLPRKEELEELIKIAEQEAGNSASAGSVLKSKSASGIDALGFGSMPAGYFTETDGKFSGENKDAYFWSSTAFDKDKAGYMYLGANNDNYGVNNNFKNLGFAVRCIKNSSEKGNVASSSSAKPSSSAASSSSVMISSSSDVSKSSASVESSSSVKSSSSSVVENPFAVITGTMIDSRDNRTYKTVTIGEGESAQTWMAENLNFAYEAGTYDMNLWYHAVSDSISWCPGNDSANCGKFGRLYTWAAAVDSAALFSEAGKGCGYNKDCKSLGTVRGICPEGWHLPSNAEWKVLLKPLASEVYDTEKFWNYYDAGTKLKSTSGWIDDDGKSGNGTDVYGFSALPAGSWHYDGDFSGEGKLTAFWSSDEVNVTYAYSVIVKAGDHSADLSNGNESCGLSVRCVKDKSDSE